MFEKTDQLRRLGLHDAQIAIDPGIAFGKSHDEDLQMLRRLGELTTLGLPLLLAHSRKNFIGSVTMRTPPERDLETHVASALAYAQGARIFRVHDAEGPVAQQKWRRPSAPRPEAPSPPETAAGPGVKAPPPAT